MGVVMFGFGLIVGILGVSGVIYVLSERDLRKLAVDYKVKSERYERAIADLEVVIRRASKVLNKEGEKLS